MSYAGPSKPKQQPRNAKGKRRTPVEQDTDWQNLAVFGTGLALGLALGAAAAMISAPRSGRETRALIRGYAGRKRQAVGDRSREAINDLRAELRGLRATWRRRKEADEAEA